MARPCPEELFSLLPPTPGAPGFSEAQAMCSAQGGLWDRGDEGTAGARGG